MIYLVAYGTIGILLVAFQKWLFNKHPTHEEKMLLVVDDSLKRVESVRYPDGAPFSDRSAQFIGEWVALIIAIVGWPVLALNLLRRVKKTPDTTIKKRDDQIDHGCCVRVITLQEIENIEQVLIGGGGASSVAFGHLNAVWLNFKAQVQPGDELWLYRYSLHGDQLFAEWLHGAEGYVIKRGGNIVAKIISNAG